MHLLFLKLLFAVKQRADIFEIQILIGRISDIYQGDPEYQDRYREHMRDVYIRDRNSFLDPYKRNNLTG
jgi:hypothetical protein